MSSKVCTTRGQRRRGAVTYFWPMQFRAPAEKIIHENGSRFGLKTGKTAQKQQIASQSGSTTHRHHVEYIAWRTWG